MRSMTTEFNALRVASTRSRQVCSPSERYHGAVVEKMSKRERERAAVRARREYLVLRTSAVEVEL